MSNDSQLGSPNDLGKGWQNDRTTRGLMCVLERVRLKKNHCEHQL